MHQPWSDDEAQRDACQQSTLWCCNSYGFRKHFQRSSCNHVRLQWLLQVIDNFNNYWWFVLINFNSQNAFYNAVEWKQARNFRRRRIGTNFGINDQICVSSWRQRNQRNECSWNANGHRLLWSAWTYEALHRVYRQDSFVGKLRYHVVDVEVEIESMALTLIFNRHLTLVDIDASPDWWKNHAITSSNILCLSLSKARIF